MPRLFTGLEIPAEIAAQLAIYRGGLSGARWIEAENFHVTLRFIGDVDFAAARDIAASLDEEPPHRGFDVKIDALSAFGGARPRALIARVAPVAELLRLQADQERLMRRIGLEPETRKYTPHVTLARLRNVSAGDVAAFIAARGHFPPLTFRAARTVLFSARDGVGGGPYLVEAAYRLGAEEGASARANASSVAGERRFG
jgi:2'-5' RNA ligase